MIDILKTVTMSPEQYSIVIEGMRNSYNSWKNSDSYATKVEDTETLVTADFEFFIGDNDMALMEKLASNGGSHSKFRRMMPVWVTVNAPLYWWKEMDTYKVGTVCNSCSTMHTITDKEFNISDFSIDKGSFLFRSCLFDVIKTLNSLRVSFLHSNDNSAKKEAFDDIIRLLPSCYNQKRTLMLNYEVLANIYRDRKNHKLDEWKEFCKWIESLPYADKLIRGLEQDGTR